MLSNRFAKVYQGSAMNPILRKAFAAFALVFISGCTKTIDLGCDDCRLLCRFRHLRLTWSSE
jgi:hypothetical protein